MRLGDIVIYLGEQVEYAAIVTAVNEDGTLDVAVIPNGKTLIAVWTAPNVPEAQDGQTDYVWRRKSAA